MRTFSSRLAPRGFASIGIAVLLSACGTAGTGSAPSGLTGGRASNGQAVQQEQEAGEAGPSVATYERFMRFAEKAERQGNLPVTAGMYQRAHNVAPDRQEPLLKLAVIYKGIGYYAQAAEAYRRAVAIDAGDSTLLVDYGVLLLIMDQPKEARIQFNRALELEESPTLYNGIAVAYDVSGDHSAAQAYYRVALEIEPGNLAARSNLGLSLALSGDHLQSIKVLKSAVAHPYATREQQRMLAAAYALAGDLPAAAEIGGPGFDEAAAREILERYSSDQGFAAASNN